MPDAPDLFSLAAWACLALSPLTARLAPASGRLAQIAAASAWIGGLAVLAGIGPAAAALAAITLVGAIYGLAWGVGRFLHAPRYDDPAVWAEAMSAVGPLVAAVAWVWSRYDRTFAGFPEPLATLTVAHFSVTFGLLPAALAAWTRAAAGAPGDTLRRAALWGIVIAPPLTGALFATRYVQLIPSPAEVAGTAGIAASLTLWWLAAPSVLVRLIMLPLLSGVWLGAGYAAALRFGWPWLGYGGMLAWHGAGNLISAALLAWRAPVPPPPSIPAPDPAPPLSPGDEATALFVDHRRRDLGPWNPAAFQAARAVLLGYRFYPPDVMRRRTSFEEEGRPARPGDRIGIGLLLPSLPGLPPIQLPAVAEIYVIEDTPERVRFGYATTADHYGMGRWRADVLRVGDRLELQVYSHIRPGRWYVWLGLPVYRYFQSRAFHRGADTLQQSVQGAQRTGG